MPNAPKTRPSKDVSSFGPEIFEALIEGSKREIVLELPYRKAVFFRQRANSLRAAMRAAGHEKSSIVAQTTLRILWGHEAGYEDVPEKKSPQGVRFPINKMAPAKLVITPADKEFSEALKKAGVTIRPLTEDTSPSPKTHIEPTGYDILERFMIGDRDK